VPDDSVKPLLVVVRKLDEKPVAMAELVATVELVAIIYTSPLTKSLGLVTLT
jgi:hypothetical protein